MNTKENKTIKRKVVASLILVFYAVLAGGSISINFGAIFKFILYAAGIIAGIFLICAIITVVVKWLKARQRAKYEQSIDTTNLETIGNESLKVYYDRENRKMTIAAFGMASHSYVEIDNFTLDEHYLGEQVCYMIDKHYPQLLSVITNLSTIVVSNVTNLAERGWVDGNGTLVSDFQVKFENYHFYLFSYHLKRLHRLKSGKYEVLIEDINLPQDLIQILDKNLFAFCQERDKVLCADLQSFKVWDFGMNVPPDEYLSLNLGKLEKVLRKDSITEFRNLFFYDSSQTLYVSEYGRNGFGEFKQYPYSSLRVMFSTLRGEKDGKSGVQSIRIILDSNGYKISDYSLSDTWINDNIDSGIKSIEDIKQKALDILSPFVQRCPLRPSIYQ